MAWLSVAIKSERVRDGLGLSVRWHARQTLPGGLGVVLRVISKAEEIRIAWCLV